MTKRKHTVVQFPITKDTTFKEVFSDPAITKPFLESLLGIHINEISIRAADEIRPGMDHKSSVLDIHAVDDCGKHFDIEMQSGHYRQLPLRSRGYGFSIDSEMIHVGTKYSEDEIKPRIIIFICLDDPFNDNLRQYTFTNRCHENGMELNDGTELICLNIHGTRGEVNLDIASFLNYAKSGKDDGNPLTRAIDKKVRELNNDERFRRYAMTFEERLEQYGEDREQEGIEKGIAEGLEKGIHGTVAVLKDLGTAEDRIVEIICKQYGLSKEEGKKYLQER